MGAPEFIQKQVAWGAGPRASQYLVLAAKARAVLSGRYAASVEDIQALLTCRYSLTPSMPFSRPTPESL